MDAKSRPATGSVSAPDQPPAPLSDSLLALLKQDPDPLADIFPPGTLGADLVQHPRHYSFFQAVRILQSGLDDRCRVGGVALPEDERLWFRAFDGLGFPSSDIDRLEAVAALSDANAKDETKDDFPTVPRISMVATFMGLHGSQSPLPTWMSEEILESSPDDNPRRDFLDFFHHRLISFLPRIWEKYRYWAMYRQGATDLFSARTFSFIGLFDEQLRDSSSDLNWERLLAYIGLLAGRNRSGDVVRGVIAHSFNLQGKVFVEEFVRRQVKIIDEQRNRLGADNCTLGRDLHIGEAVLDRNGKFRLWLGPLNFETFFSFLPIHQSFDTLRQLIAFMLRDQLAYDLCLTVERSGVPPFCLSQPSCLLGWSTWLGTPDAQDQSVILTARQ